jgi:oligosaccharide repeat unit polymerase
MIYIPSFFVYFDVQGRNRHIYLFAVHSVLLTVPIGMIIVNRIRNFRPVEIRWYFETPLQENVVSLHHFALIALGVVIALGLMVMHVGEMGTIPLFYLIQSPGESLATSLLREEALKLLDSRFTYFYTLLINVGFPFLILTTLGYYLITRQFKWFVLFFITASSGLLYVALGTAKGPAAAVIVQIGLFVYLYRRGSFSKKAFILSLVLTFVFPLVVVMLSYEIALDIALWGLGGRVFYSPALTVYWYFELFPGHTDYLYGMSIGRLAWLLGVEPFDTPNYVAMEGLRMRMESANANGAFIGNLNADFGIVGVLCGGVVAGVLMQMIQVSLIRYPKTIFNLVVYAFCICAFWNLHSTALPVVLMTNGVLFVLVFSWLIQRSIKMLRIGVTEIKPLPPTPS